jgi:hypothetical protein
MEPGFLRGWVVLLRPMPRRFHGFTRALVIRPRPSPGSGLRDVPCEVPTWNLRKGRRQPTLRPCAPRWPHGSNRETPSAQSGQPAGSPAGELANSASAAPGEFHRPDKDPGSDVVARLLAFAGMQIICHHTMFIRYRQTQSRLQASLAETRRIDGKVRHEHIASFGSVPLPLSVTGRLTFWQQLHERLARLSNRLDDAARAKVLGDIHARIPMVTFDEQHALKLANAEADERFWSDLHDAHAATVADHKGLATAVEHRITKGLDDMAKAAAQRDTAKERRERLERDG